ncbi:glycosyltransferase family 4 protein [Rhodococcus ruber]|uniref:glycosyltransferase family 4 protein n=1 Tax=Rhodococcus ruber TaxID=1830 RepID=UPI003B22352A
MLRIALVHSYYSSESPSGENVTVDAQAAALVKRGYEVKIIGTSTDYLQESRLYPIRAAVTASGFGGLDPTNQLRQFNPHIVHVHNQFPNWGTGWMKSWRRPIVSTLHNYRTICSNALLWRDGHDCVDCLSHGSFQAIKNKCYRNSALSTLPLAIATRSSGRHSAVLNQSSAIIVLNDAAKEHYNQIIPDAPIYTIPNFSPHAELQQAHRSPAWIYVGRLTEEKGVGWLADNWPVNETLTIIGSGPLENYVRQICLKNPRIQFLGRQSPEATVNNISKSRGLVLPSMWSEGIPTVALEALQTATPILISDACSSARRLVAGGAGEIFISGDITSLRQAMSSVKTAPDSYSHQAAVNYEKSFSENAWLDNISKVYQSVLSK